MWRLETGYMTPSVFGFRSFYNNCLTAYCDAARLLYAVVILVILSKASLIGHPRNNARPTAPLQSGTVLLFRACI